MGPFLLLWFGQLISVLGTGLSSFCLGLRVYQRTGSVTQFSIVAVMSVLPGLLLSPAIGVLVDRWNRRRSMLLADVVAGLATAGLMALSHAGPPPVLCIYIGVGILSCAASLMWTAYSAAVTQLVDSEHLGRANGMVQGAEALSQIAAPLLAGILVSRVSLHTILLIDSLTYAFAVLATWTISIPDRPAVPTGRLGEQMLAGWRYIRCHRGLLALLSVIASNNFVLGLMVPLLTPLVLSFAGPTEVGTVLALSGAGTLCGGVAMALWGGPRLKVDGVLGGTFLAGVALLLGPLWPSVLSVGTGIFVLMFLSSVIIACSQAIWQKIVPLDLQGRVFAVRRAVAQLSWPLGALLAGPLTDRVFEPLMRRDGVLSESAGRLLGVGSGRGIALFLCCQGILFMLIAIGGYQSARLRRMEESEAAQLSQQGSAMTSPDAA
jgi:MFS family permease